VVVWYERVAKKNIMSRSGLLEIQLCLEKGGGGEDKALRLVWAKRRDHHEISFGMLHA
jgi:hypothetical protein